MPTVNPIQGTVSYNQEGTAKFQFLFERRVWTTHIAPQLLRLPPEEWPPNHLAVRRIGTFHNESHRTRANLEAVVRWAREHSLQLSPWTQCRENRQNYPFPSFFSGRGLTAPSTSYCLRVQLLISLRFRLTGILLRAWKNQWAVLPTSPSCSLHDKSNFPGFPGKSSSAHLHPNFYICHLRNEKQASKSPSSDRQWGSYSQVPQDFTANKKQIFNRHTSTPPGYTPGLSTEEQAKTLIISQFLPGRGLTAYFSSCCRRDQLLTSPHLVADWDPSGSLKEPGGSSPCLPWLTPTVKPSLQFLPERSLSTYLAPQLLRLPPEEWCLKLPSLVSQWGSAFTSSTEPSWTRKKSVSYGHSSTSCRYPPCASCRGRKWKHPSPSCFLEGIWLQSFQLLPGIHLLVSLSVGAGWNSPGSLTELAGSQSHHARSNSKTKPLASSWQQSPYIQHSKYYSCHSRDWLPNRLVFTGDGLDIHELPGTTQKKVVLAGSTITLGNCALWLSTTWTSKTNQLLVCPS